VAARRLDVELPDVELEAREPASASTHAAPARGWERLYVDHVLQADKGADLDFLTGSSGSAVRRESH
jgi:dihydroxy-acid dehydratase